MTGKEAYEIIVNKLKDTLGEREAYQIAKIYFEDKFNTLIPSLKASLTEPEINQLQEDIVKLNEGYPIAYLTGKSHFYGLIYSVDESVLIPRPETEELVNWLIEDLTGLEPKRILDVGTGSGCIPISIARNLEASLTGTDISKEALNIARLNAENCKVNVDFIELDSFSDQFVDVFSQAEIVISNPPYIAIDDLDVDHSTFTYEPHLALYADEGGMAFYRRFAELLRKDQVLYLELNEFLGEDIGQLFEAKGFKCQFKRDLQGKIRMLKVGEL